MSVLGGICLMGIVLIWLTAIFFIKNPMLNCKKTAWNIPINCTIGWVIALLFYKFMF